LKLCHCIRKFAFLVTDFLISGTYYILGFINCRTVNTFKNIFSIVLINRLKSEVGGSELKLKLVALGGEADVLGATVRDIKCVDETIPKFQRECTQKTHRLLTFKLTHAKIYTTPLNSSWVVKNSCNRIKQSRLLFCFMALQCTVSLRSECCSERFYHLSHRC